VKKKREFSAAERILAAVDALPEPSMTELAEAVRAQAKVRGLMIQLDGPSYEMVPVALSPWIFTPEVERYLKGFFRGIRRSVNRVLAHYFEDEKLQAILPLRESELKWLKAGCTDGIPRPQTIFERFDTNLGPHPEQQLNDFQVIEFNGVGVGCVYLIPAATELLQEHLFPRLKESLQDLSLNAPADYRQLLLQELQVHARAIERPACRVGLIERRETVSGGCDEFTRISSFFGERGVTAVVGDPREIEQKGNDLLLKGEPVDVLYRDFQLEEVVSIKTHGGSVDGIETAFARNQVVSTVFGEFDHKSLCELLSNPEFAGYFSPLELRAARKHFPWTRLVLERKTTDAQGKEVDLVPHIRENRERLVLKPNRGYGGEGVVVGDAVGASVWEEALGKAVEKPKSWVVQEQVSILKAPIVLLEEKGRPKVQERYVTLGVTATPRGVSFVGRCSERPVVNISQGGGLVPVFLAGKRS